MNIISERKDLGGGLIVSSLYAENTPGVINRLVTDYLLEFVSELTLEDISELEEILSGSRLFSDGDVGLMEVNGKSAWVRVRSGCPVGLMVENEYAPHRSIDGPGPHEFSADLVYASLSAWKLLRDAEQKLGRKGSVGVKFNVPVEGYSRR